MKSILTILIAISFLLTQPALSQLCSNDSTGFIPINDLGTGIFHGSQGGLYPGGSNSRPFNHNNDGIDYAYQILPLDTAGNYNPATGRIVLLSVGMSNCAQEYQVFLNIVNASTYKHPRVTVVNGAQGGQTIDIILNPNATFWTIIQQRLTQIGATVKQVQAVWFKEAQASPTDTSFPGYPSGLRDKFKTVMGIMKTKYVNLKLCYNASRIYAGYATGTLNPEPYAYYSGWSVKWLIEDQINGDTNLIYKGTNIKSPWLSWGPYLWADGLEPRSDGLIWTCPTDFAADGVHPSATGQQKVAMMLVNFFTRDVTTKPWFLKNLTLNLTLSIEGFLNTGPSTLNMRDTISVYLRNNVVPYNLVDSAKNVVDSVSLTGIMKFYNMTTGNYYLQVKHRNTIETWSKAGGEALALNSFVNYDFTTAASQSYSSNVVLVGTEYSFYGGDVNQDGYVDVADVLLVFNDASAFVTGYVPTDVTGDNTTDVADLILAFNNSSAFVGKITP